MSEKRKILLITTTHTGCGHKSISDALIDWFVDMPEVEVKLVDGFEDLVGKSVTALGDMPACPLIVVCVKSPSTKLHQAALLVSVHA